MGLDQRLRARTQFEAQNFLGPFQLNRQKNSCTLKKLKLRILGKNATGRKWKKGIERLGAVVRAQPCRAKLFRSWV